MRMFFSDEEIAQLIAEDVPFLDLTTYGLNIGKELGEIEFSTRHTMTICATEEAARVFEKCGAKVEYLLESGTCLTAQQLILKASGCAEALHIGWRVALNLMEYASGIATRAKELVDAAKNVNSDVAVVTTRKCFPGTRIISMKAILAGGATPHRLGLSETVLIFKQHLLFIDSIAEISERINQMRKRFPEQKIAIEVETETDAWMVAEAGVDLIQFDKIPTVELGSLVTELKQKYPGLKLAAAGGINLENVRNYASTGVDILVTSYPYFGKPADIGAKMKRR
ncbi:ModD protein [Cylindrospermopsis raciborskii]|uniref:Putative pyrophosphorylase ModD n=2 Tax=Aphanizomenonaceae TaxID=1892259 RepID=A0A853M8K1_9CYAN|nr:ModD protein [Cylindrospermopsis raciborskii]OBU75451.1 ModD protein [Cylindrospermopsis raciborskii CS-505]BAZ79339.1 molybdenum transport system protein ModD [Sphaerospermopsis kisseleviana NIES-73]